MAPSVLPIWWCLLCCMCALPAFDTTATAFTTTQKNAFVQAHNRLRTTASPQVANMNFMIWDDELEKVAKELAAKCPQERNAISGLKTLQAANLYVGTGVDPVTITNDWYSKPCDNENIMWHSTDKIGCATKQDCSNPNQNVVCVYNKPEDQPKVGWPCSRCPATTNKCIAGLCALDTAIDASKKTNLLGSNAAEVALDTVAGSECRFDCGGSTAGTSDANTCKCSCNTAGNFGWKCQHKSEMFTNSVRLKISPISPLTRVPQSVFDEIKGQLLTQLATSAKAHCEAHYATCCPSGGAKKDKPYAAFKLIESTIKNDCDGTLYLNVYGDPVTTTDEKLCEQAPPTIVPKTVLTAAVTGALKATAISTALNTAKITITIAATDATSDEATTPTAACPGRTACVPTTPTPKPKPADPNATVNQTNNKPTNPGNSNVPSNPGKPGNTGAPPPAKDKLASRTATASLALMLISCIGTVALLCVQSLAF